MASLEQLKLTFFEECNEALREIESGLTALREGMGSDDTINAVFRSVHSVKGGAGIFGFDGLVNFAHVFETVLDAMRDGALGATPDVIDVLLPANDVLSDLIALSRAGEPIPAHISSASRIALEGLLLSRAPAKDGGWSEDDDGTPAPAEFEGIDFIPVRAEQFDDGAPQPASAAEPGSAGECTYRIVFRPYPDLLKKANEPLFLLRELRQLGQLDLTVETDRLPPLAEIEPDHPYLAWTGTLRTSAPREAIEEVFEFVVGDCELVIDADVAAAAAPADREPASADLLAWSAEPDAVVANAESPVLFPVVQPTAAALPTVAPLPPVEPLPTIEAPSIDMTAPAAAAGVAASRATTSRPMTSSATTTRVELEKIDRVVNMVGELVISQAMLGQVVHALPEEVRGSLLQVLDEVVHHTRGLKDSVMSMRAQQVSAVFQRMPRLVRELATKTGKKVRLEIAGENTEVDRSIIERLGDPLTHIIRNAIDHGIEAPSARAKAGKAEEGTIRLAAEHRGSRIVIEISDDGAGINPEGVLKKARDRGLVGVDANLSEDEIYGLIFLPGFSTAETVSDISGRGVGMDVVRRNIQDVGGRISIKSERGRGMTIQLALPLTLAVMDGMVVRVAQETYVMPMSAIVECLRPPTSDVRDLIGTRGVLQLRGSVVPLVHLGELLDVAGAAPDGDERVVIIGDAGDGARFGIIVDELCGHQQVVVKSIEESYGSVPGIAGATILGNGRVAFILDIEKFADLASNQNLAAGVSRFTSAAPSASAIVN
jgi:two-component system chemotaxis sensor kinase CheA